MSEKQDHVSGGSSIANEDVTIVMQGGLGGEWDIRYSARYLREVMPGVKIILATQKTSAKSFDDGSDFDAVILTQDPGPLPSVKLVGAPHNVNRQIVSSAAGLAAVTTPYAMKLRTDSYLSSRRAVELWSRWGEANPGPRQKGQARILVMSLFSLNPHYDERLCYHLSDFMQFGRTEDLRAFWNGPQMDLGTNTYYERHPYAAHSLPREREFRSLYGTEQWLTLGYLFGEGPYPIAYHNDVDEQIIDEFEEYLADNFIVAHPFDVDLHMPKHQHVFTDRYFNAICYSFEDWKRLVGKRSNLTGSDIGYTRWPTNDRDKRSYVAVRQRLRWFRRFALARAMRRLLPRL
ncbi:WavE lipopolysaccharide synthesis family protein [Tianweitania populi]|uniref:WavE lipopolysaccharide synthesis n=1 Tax=Tianweitania populi TaxID=1607949 RepID=A0A8J3DZ15_9HYPH|nr:WavE lipopolysaccharide synthesis family protein [Tianweitania populi]GHD21420.1 hypothetical protein GCM10016234_35050 [Tianweitania populi]